MYLYVSQNCTGLFILKWTVCSTFLCQCKISKHEGKAEGGL